MKKEFEVLKSSYKVCVMKMFESIGKLRSPPLEPVYEAIVGGATGCNLSQPLSNVATALLSTLVKTANLFSRKSFEAAYLTAETLERKTQLMLNLRASDLSICDKDAKCIHPTWSSLADRGCSLLVKTRNFGYQTDTIIEALNSSGRLLKDLTDKLHDPMIEYNRRKLLKIISNTLESNIEDSLKYTLVNYIAEHLFALSGTLGRTGKILLDDIRYYLEVVFEGNCFLEYEVYAAFLEHGVPALPRLRLSYPEYLEAQSSETPEENSSDKEASERIKELDVVAAPQNELWLAEVTKSETREKLGRKAEKLDWLARELEAEETLIVCTRAALKKAEELPKLEKVTFIAFEDLSSELQRLIKNARNLMNQSY
jgi:hypothetical protein